MLEKVEQPNRLTSSEFGAPLLDQRGLQKHASSSVSVAVGSRHLRMKPIFFPAQTSLFLRHR